jgi:hypothetical protein
MFVQLIQGHVTDPAAVRAEIEHWVQDVAPGATGWLGSTGGVTDDGRLIALVRFESEAAARANSARPEQDSWWSTMSRLFTDEPTFTESDDVVLDLVGDPDRAGFVQIMRGQGSNTERARELIGQDSAEWAAFRPEVLGSVGVMHDDGGFTMAIYFTDEAAARAGEGKEPPAKLKAQMDELTSLQTGVPDFFDLREPWMHSAR